MKVGIISMQRVFNYGSFLQAFALKKILEERGHEVSFVDIDKNTVVIDAKRSKGIRFLKKIKYIDRYLFRRIEYSRKNKQLNDVFRKSQQRYLKLDNMHMESDGCNAVIIGSDEIFNCSSDSEWGITGQRFGNIPNVEFVASYAASCGYTDESYLRPDDRNTIINALQKMSDISVRDKNTSKFIKNLIGKVPVEHLDPVLIYNFENQVILGEKEGVPDTPYMIVYAYHNRIESKHEIKAIKNYARKKHLKTIAIGGSLPWCDEFAVLSPFQMLAYFKHAACIVTDTFHGTIFSVKFRKPFAVIVRDSNANKLVDLLERLKIMNHMVTDISMLQHILSQSDNLEECYNIIEFEKERSYKYIESVGL